MKLKEMQSTSDPELPAWNDKFNRTVLNTGKGQIWLSGKILNQAKWLFIMPAEYLEQLIMNLEVRKEPDPEQEVAKEKIVKTLKALVPVKKHLDEAWGDIEV